MRFRFLAGVLGGLLALACAKEREAAQRMSAETSPVSSASEALETLDTRTPVPLLPMMAHHQKQNMRDHLLVVQEIIAASAKGDYATIEQSAKRIGYSEHMGRMCAHMGAGAPGFTDRAVAFHRTADGIAEAARQNDMPAVLTTLGETLSACTSCHAAFKQRVVASLGEPR